MLFLMYNYLTIELCKINSNSNQQIYIQSLLMSKASYKEWKGELKMTPDLQELQPRTWGKVNSQMTLI